MNADCKLASEPLIPRLRPRALTSLGMNDTGRATPRWTMPKAEYRAANSEQRPSYANAVSSYVP